MPGLFYPPFSLLWQTFRPASVFSKKRKMVDNRLIINHLPRAENGTRTRDLNLGKVALYQLSYFRIACFAIASAKVNKKSETPNFSAGSADFLLRNRPEYPYLNTRMRSSSGLNVFSPGSPAGVPNGICAISLHSSGRLQRLRTSLSISGL